MTDDNKSLVELAREAGKTRVITYLDVPESEVEELKAIGGAWYDPEKEKWFIPGNWFFARYAKWLPKEE